jgi:hypothetical protein
MAVTFNNNNTDVQATNASSFSASMSVTAGQSNLAAVARIIISGATGASGISGQVTYNSVNMTAAGAFQGDARSGGAVLYALGGSATGSNTLAFSITNGPASTIYADLTSYFNVNQSTPVRPSSFTSAFLTTSASTIAATVNSATGDMTTTCASDSSGATTVSSTNQTQRNIDNGGHTSFGSDDAAGAATVTHTWTLAANSTGRLIAGFSIQQVSAATLDGQICLV